MRTPSPLRMQLHGAADFAVVRFRLCIPAGTAVKLEPAFHVPTPLHPCTVQPLSIYQDAKKRQQAFSPHLPDSGSCAKVLTKGVCCPAQQFQPPCSHRYPPS